jgi:hypothetical protein
LQIAKKKFFTEGRNFQRKFVLYFNKNKILLIQSFLFLFPSCSLTQARKARNKETNKQRNKETKKQTNKRQTSEPNHLVVKIGIYQNRFF